MTELRARDIGRATRRRPARRRSRSLSASTAKRGSAARCSTLPLQAPDERGHDALAVMLDRTDVESITVLAQAMARHRGRRRLVFADTAIGLPAESGWQRQPRYKVEGTPTARARSRRLSTRVGSESARWTDYEAARRDKNNPKYMPRRESPHRRSRWHGLDHAGVRHAVRPRDNPYNTRLRGPHQLAARRRAEPEAGDWLYFDGRPPGGTLAALPMSTKNKASAAPEFSARRSHDRIWWRKEQLGSTGKFAR